MMTSAAPKAQRTKSQTTRVTCGGDDGHPVVTLEMGDVGQVQCPYCNHVYVLAAKGDKS